VAVKKRSGFWIVFVCCGSPGTLGPSIPWALFRVTVFFQKGDGTGRSVLAIEPRVPALQAFLAQIDLVFGTSVGGFPFRMIGTGTHRHPLFLP